MIPAYEVSPEQVMEVVYAVSQTGPDTTQEDIQRFTDYSDRRIRECLKLGIEFGLIEEDESYRVSDSYRKKINEVSIGDRDVLLNRALIQYRPFRAFVAYLRKGYTPPDAARQTNVVHDIANDEEYILDYFSRFGEFAGLIDSDTDSFEISVEAREIPVDSVQSVEALRNALESEAEIRFYIEGVIGPAIMSRIDVDTEDELVKAFSVHAEESRDSISASGRALEDFLREIGRNQGAEQSRLESAGGPTQVGNVLIGESIIRDTHLKRIKALSAIRSKGGAHGDDQVTGNRWRTDAEVALSTGMETTVLIRSIGKHVYDNQQVL